MTQLQLSESADVSRKSINAIENGIYVPSTVLALKISKTLKCKVEELFKDGLPPIQKGFSPVEDWECNPKYCSFYETCGGGIKGIQERENKWTKR